MLTVDGSGPICNSALVQFLGALITLLGDATTRLRLASAGPADPAVTDVLTDYTECTWSTYAPQNISAGPFNSGFDENGDYVITFSTAFQADNPITATDTIQYILVTEGMGDGILGVAKLDSSILVATDNQLITLTIVFNVSKGTFSVDV